MLAFPHIRRGRGAYEAPADPQPVVDDLDVEFPSVPCNGLRARWQVGASGRPELTWVIAGLDDPPAVTHLLPRFAAERQDKDVRRSA